MDELVNIIRSIEKKIEEIARGQVIKRVTIPDDGYLIVRKLSVDPASPQDGEIWYNTTSNKYKCCENGVVKTITTS